MFVEGHKALRWVFTRGVEATYGVRMFSGRVMGQLRRFGSRKPPVNAEDQGRASRVRAAYYAPARISIWTHRLSRSKEGAGRDSREAILECWERDREYLRERGIHPKVIEKRLVERNPPTTARRV